MNEINIDENVVVQEKLVLRANQVGDPPHIATGTIIVRSVLLFDTGRFELMPVPFRITEQKTYIFKATWNEGLFTNNFHITYKSFAADGVVCFCSDYVDKEDIIAFGVKGVAKNKKSLFVAPITGSIDKLINKYYAFPQNIIKM
jgi:hypothetical protein